MNAAQQCYDRHAAAREFRFRAAEVNDKYRPTQIVRFSALRATIAPRENKPSVEERWSTYLNSLPARQLASEEVVDAARQLWRNIRQLYDRATPPNARPTDEGGLRWSWVSGGRYLEITLFLATYEWYFRDSNISLSDGDEEVPVTTVPAKLVDALRKLLE